MESKNQSRGIQLFELNRFEEAIPYFNDALKTDVEDTTSKYYLVLCYINLEAFDKASPILTGLQKDDPNNPDVPYLWAQILFQQEMDKLALNKINESISMDPYNDDYFGLKAGILLSLKKYEEALGTVEEGLRINAKNAYCLNIRAQILTKLDRKDEANATVDNILQDNPEDAYSHANVGWVELEHGNTKKALNHFKEALRFDPNFEYARQGMSTAIKGKNPLYSAYLKYAFWISKKSSKNQWFFIIGLYLIYRFSVKLLTGLGLTYLAIPLMVLYLLFALGSWLMEPLSNTILNFDKYGKYLLSSSERKSGHAFAALLLLSLVLAITFYVLNIEYLLVLSVTFLCLLLIFPRSFLLHSVKAKNAAQVYAFIMAIIGISGPFFLGNWTAGLIVFGMMLLYTWIGNFIEEL